jgi:excisionase family DNA binding protein
VDSAAVDVDRARLRGMSSRFLTLADVTEVLNISAAQAYALVRSGDLPAIQIGGRAQWRVEATELEAYIERMYAQTRARIDAGTDEPES